MGDMPMEKKREDTSKKKDILQETDIIEMIESETEELLDGILVVNMDNFNKVNEKFGVEEGDRLLDIVYDEIQHTFRGTDMVVRLKGDEFIVFNKNIGDINNAETLAENVLRAIAGAGAKNNCTLSGSVGIAIYPIHGNTYDDLKNKAYQSMYRAKNSGKNRFRLFDSARTKALYHEAINNRNALFEVLNRQDFSFDTIKGTNLSEIAIHILYEERDIISALNSIVELLCIYLGFSKTYILTTQKTDIHDLHKIGYSIPGYENGVQSEIIQMLREDLVCRLYDEYKDVTLLHFEDENLEINIQEYMDSQKIKDLLFLPILKGEEFFGGVVFENQTDNIIDFQTETLQMLKREMHVIQSYISNINSKRKNKEYISKLEMLDNIDAYVYIVDMNTYELTFVNRKSQKCSTLPQIGEKCYKIARNNETPCEDCPFKEMNKDDAHASAVQEFYNYIARKWTKNLYSMLDTIENNGKCIIISVDINDYFDK